MGIVRIDNCCGPKINRPKTVTLFFQALEEITITAEVHQLQKVPSVTVYDSAGYEIEPEVQVNEQNFNITIRQELPAIALYVSLN